MLTNYLVFRAVFESTVTLAEGIKTRLMLHATKSFQPKHFFSGQHRPESLLPAQMLNADTSELSSGLDDSASESRQGRGPALPTPAGNIYATPHVLIQPLGLVVKYGANVNVAEALKTHKQQLSIPEVFSLAEQRFIYMPLIEGATLQRAGDVTPPTVLAADRSKLSTGLDEMIIFPESSFFKKGRGPALPTPAEIRAINKELGHILATPPVVIPSLGLIVKYGTHITIAEAHTQLMMRELLQGQVPVPEIFGLAEDGGQRFIYMSLIEGGTLLERWGDMNEDERRAICEELKRVVNVWRALEQVKHNRYIGEFLQMHQASKPNLLDR